MVACCYDMRLTNVRRTYVCCKILLVMLSQAFFLPKKLFSFHWFLTLSSTILVSLLISCIGHIVSYD